MTDDQRVGTLSVMPKTTKWFAKEGVRFTKAFVPIPLCCPARASLFTGRYAHNHDVKNNALAENLNHGRTLQRYLDDAGYSTALVGKFLNGRSITRDPPHFDRWATFGGGYWDRRFNLDGEVQVVDGYTTDVLADRAVSLLDEMLPGSDPVFMVVTPFAPHAEPKAAPRHVGAPVPPYPRNPATRPYDRKGKPRWVLRRDEDEDALRAHYRQQMRSLMAVDDLVGRVVGKLKAEGELDNTLAFFLSDNGYLWGEHELGFGTYGKRNPYTHGVRIPLLARWPGRFDAGEVDRRLVNLIDVAPTVLHAADLNPPGARDGYSLLSNRDRKHTFVEYFRDPLNGEDVPTWASIRTRRFHFTEYFDKGQVVFREYYRLRTDPWELRNVLRDGKPSNDPDVALLHDRLRRYRRCSGKSCP